MSPHRFSDIVIVGVIAGGWWEQLGPVKKTLGVIVTLLIIGFTAGTLVTTTMMEQRGVPARLARVERVAIRDSIRVEELAMKQLRLDTDFEVRLRTLEHTLERVDDRTKRIACLLAGGSGPACL